MNEPLPKPETHYTRNDPLKPGVRTPSLGAASEIPKEAPVRMAPQSTIGKAVEGLRGKIAQESAAMGGTKAFLAKKVLPYAALPIEAGAAGYDIAKHNEAPTIEKVARGAEGIGRGAAATAGLIGGAKLGALAGSVVPGAGNVIGGAVGGLVGGVGGYFAPDLVAKGLRAVGAPIDETPMQSQRWAEQDAKNPAPIMPADPKRGTGEAPVIEPTPVVQKPEPQYDGLRELAAQATPAAPERSIDETNALARGERLALEDRMAQQDRQTQRSMQEQGLMGELRQAKYERDLATNQPRQSLWDPKRKAAKENYVLAQAALGGFRQNQTELEKTRMLSDSHNRSQDAGLRNAMEIAKMRSASDKYSTDATMQSNLMGRELQMLQLRQQIGDKNAKGREELMDKRLQVFKQNEKGESVLDLEGSHARKEAFRRFQLNPTADDMKIVRSIVPGARTINDVPDEKWGSIMDVFNAHQGSLGTAGRQGLPTRITAHERGFGDVFRGADDSEESQVGAVSTLINNFNPTAPMDRNTTLRIETPGSKAVLKAMEDYARTPDERMVLFQQLSQNKDPTSQAILKELLQKYGGQ
jgi:hypothetical protein